VYERRIEIAHEADVQRAAMLTRKILKTQCAASEAVLLSTVTSELATNLMRYAKGGYMHLKYDGKTRQISIKSQDDGPGIEDIPRAMQEGYSGGKGLGVGLPAVQRLTDKMNIYNRPEGGLCVETQCRLKTRSK